LILLIVSWAILLFLFVGISGIYYLFLRRKASQKWNLVTDPNYSPSVTIIIPTHNEQKTIGLKLENLKKVDYPVEKMQIILVDDASTDNTVLEVNKFMQNNSELKAELLRQTQRTGKSKALNSALEYALNGIVVMSDADAFWAPDILKKALPYLADPAVGAIVGRQIVLNREQSWVTQAEAEYLDFVFDVVRLGESKIHSTIIFHGSFGAYKKEVLGTFNIETDDSGTALDIVQKGGRTVLADEAICFDISPSTWRGKFTLKNRRASQLVQIWGRCAKLLLKGELRLPKRISIPEIYIYLVNPVTFIAFALASLFLIWSYFPFSFILLAFAAGALVIRKSRLLLVELFQSNFILVIALSSYLSGKKFITWKPLEEPRSILTRDLLKTKNLI